MDKQFVIFDMDGTLVDSMPYWDRLAVECLGSRGVEQVSRELLERLKPLTLEETAAFLTREYHWQEPAETVAAEMERRMQTYYQREIPLKKGVKEYLLKLREHKVRMCVASATPEHLMEVCLGRLGVLDLFEFVLSCERVGCGKSRPDVYHAAAKRLGAVPEEVAVFEDALHAAETAKKANYYVVGVYDAGAAPHWDALSALSDEQIQNWEDA